MHHLNKSFSSNEKYARHAAKGDPACKALRDEARLTTIMESLGLPKIPPPRTTSFGLFFQCPVKQCKTCLISKPALLNHLISIHSSSDTEENWLKKTSSTCLSCKQTVYCDEFYLHKC